MSIQTWLIISGIIFISGIIKGTTGFGFALISIPFLVYFIPIKILIPIITFYNLSSSIQILFQLREIKITKRIIILSIMGIIGVILGSLLLLIISNHVLKLFTSVFLILISILFLAGYRFKVRKLKRGNIIAGVISGFFGGATSMSGPTLALFLTSINLETQHFRHTFAWFSVLTSIIAIFDYIKIGLVTLDSITIFGITLPILFLSVFIGKTISVKIPQRLFYKTVIVTTLLAGILLLYNSVK